jgi:hypothetical protein
MWGLYILAVCFAATGIALAVAWIFVRSIVASWAVMTCSVICIVLAGVMAWLPG